MIDPLPDLGKRLPPELYSELIKAPPLMTVREAVPYLKLSERQIRKLLRDKHLVGVGGSRKGSKRCVIPRASVFGYWEQQWAARS